MHCVAHPIQSLTDRTNLKERLVSSSTVYSNKLQTLPVATTIAWVDDSSPSVCVEKYTD